jgi:RAQPRD family integrative conjugative element protein
MRLTQPIQPKNQHVLPFAMALVLILCCINTQADSPVSESTNLELILRQLDAIDRIARASEALPVQDGARYFFDYPRFAAEIELMRQGIKAYQTPIRAQPRQAPELTGHYLRQGKSAP